MNKSSETRMTSDWKSGSFLPIWSAATSQQAASYLILRMDFIFFRASAKHIWLSSFSGTEFRLEVDRETKTNTKAQMSQTFVLQRYSYACSHLSYQSSSKLSECLRALRSCSPSAGDQTQWERLQRKSWMKIPTFTASTTLHNFSSNLEF